MSLIPEIKPADLAPHISNCHSSLGHERWGGLLPDPSPLAVSWNFAVKKWTLLTLLLFITILSNKTQVHVAPLYLTCCPGDMSFLHLMLSPFPHLFRMLKCPNPSGFISVKLSTTNTELQGLIHSAHKMQWIHLICTKTLQGTLRDSSLT